MSEYRCRRLHLARTESNSALSAAGAVVTSR